MDKVNLQRLCIIDALIKVNNFNRFLFIYLFLFIQVQILTIYTHILDKYTRARTSKLES